MNLTYLAAPYTPIGVTDEVEKQRTREDRYRECCKAAAELMRQGRVVFSPISHSHPIDAFFDAPGSGEFWKRQDEPYLSICTEMVVLTLPGWSQSAGVRHEIEVAQFRGIPITYMDPQ